MVYADDLPEGSLEKIQENLEPRLDEATFKTTKTGLLLTFSVEYRKEVENVLTRVKVNEKSVKYTIKEK